MSFLKAIGLVILCLLAGGFGLCALTSVWFAFGAPVLLVLTIVMSALTWLCVLGIRAINRSDDTPENEGSAARKND